MPKIPLHCKGSTHGNSQWPQLQQLNTTLWAIVRVLLIQAACVSQAYLFATNVLLTLYLCKARKRAVSDLPRLCSGCMTMLVAIPMMQGQRPEHHRQQRPWAAREARARRRTRTAGAASTGDGAVGGGGADAHVCQPQGGAAAAVAGVRQSQRAPGDSLRVRMQPRSSASRGHRSGRDSSSQRAAG